MSYNHHPQFKAELVAKLSKKLKPKWMEGSLVGFLDVMASLNKQLNTEKIMEWMNLKDLTVLVIMAEEEREKQNEVS